MADTPQANDRRANEPANRHTADDHKTPWPLWLFLIAAILVVLWVRGVRQPRPDDALLGRAIPPLETAGWLNTNSPPSAESLQGKVVLIDFWATWCGYCVQKMPDLVRFYNRFKDHDLVVIGLTSESAYEKAVVESYVSSVPGLAWPIGYGANIPFDVLGIEALPTMVLFDRSGKSVWTGWNLDGLEDAVVRALAE